MQARIAPDIQPMRYRAPGGADLAVTGAPSPAGQDPDFRLREQEQQFGRQLEKVRREALEQGRQSAFGEQAARNERSAAQLQGAIESFRADRDRYFARVEHEVVKLALALAERILHREAQLDPLLLCGAVRVALGQLADSTEVRLRVPTDQQEMWAETVRLMPGLSLRPQVLGDPGIESCEAVLDTNLGTVNLGVHAQLREIERGFFDLLDARNATKDQAARADGSAKRE
jgi:flagellar assembly protein FliH